MLSLGAEEIVWSSKPSAGANLNEIPWTPEPRPSADGKLDAIFWSSLPSGESLTGTFHSGPFDLPAELSFFIAGHNGPTSLPEDPRNFVRLRDAITHEILAEAKPPRNDVAQSVTWDLRTFAGHRGYVEIMDGFDATGFAWLAVGRFSLSALNPDHFQPGTAALALIAQFQLQEFSPRLKKIALSNEFSTGLRRRAAETLLSFAPDARISAVLGTVAGTEVDLPSLVERIWDVVCTRDEEVLSQILEEVVRRSTYDELRHLAKTLSADQRGAEALLALVAAGQVSPRVLLDPEIHNLLTASQVANLDARVSELTTGLPSEDDRIRKLIEVRSSEFHDARANEPEGAKIFEKHCATCHAVQGKGTQIGPQLDGVGGRGLARLMEDVLDPNRNVDPAFRTITLVMSDGRIVSGLKRRNEGQTLILVNNEGKEFEVGESDIEARQQTALSLMPSNFGETLGQAEVRDLVAFLLTLRAAPPGQP
jgi:putative heme-binding domain-containing protein